MVTRFLAACLASVTTAVFGRSLDYLQHPMFTHHGAAEEFYQNPAAAAASDGLTLGLGNAGHTGSWNAILPLPGGTRLGYHVSGGYETTLHSAALAWRGANSAEAEGWTAGLGFRWDAGSDVYVFDPGARLRRRLEGKGEIEFATYTFALLGSRDSDNGGGYFGDDPVRIRTQWVAQAGWISPSRLWELAGSVEPLIGNEGAPGYYRNVDPIRHLEAGIRPVPWCKLAFKMTEWGIREFRCEIGRKTGGLANAILFRMAGLRDYHGHPAIFANLQLSLFGNLGKRP